MEIPQGNTLEKSGKLTPKMGFKSPTEQRRKSSAGNKCANMIVGRALAISSDLFSNVDVGDFPDLHF
jgi:hypothetical protein